MTDKEKLEAIRAEIHRLVDVRGYDKEMANDLFTFMNSLPNEHVSNDLEEASKKYSSCIYLEEVLSDDDREVLKERLINTFKAGAQWQKEHPWKPADGDDLPEIDKEVIALIEAFGHYKVIFAHRVDENAEIHTSIDGKPLVLHPKKHGKGGWNISNIKWWLDIELPKIEE